MRVLNSLRSLSLSGDPRPNYVRLEWEADDKEIRSPPTTHLIATVDDLTDMLDFDSEDIDGTDDDAGEEQEPPPTGRWTATSSHDIYMVDPPTESNDEERQDPAKDCCNALRSMRQVSSSYSLLLSCHSFACCIFVMSSCALYHQIGRAHV